MTTLPQRTAASPGAGWHHRNLPSPATACELGPRDTHAIGFWPSNRLIADSAGRGWHDAYAALATVNSWSGPLAPVGHPCLAYCLHRPAQLRRRLDRTGRSESRTVRPRQFFVIPAHEATDWQRHGSSDMLMLYLRQDLLDTVARTLSSRSPENASLDLGLGTTDPFMEQVALSILRVLRSPEDGTSALYVDGLVQALALHLLHGQGLAACASEGSSPPAPALRRVADLIEADLGADLTIACLAREAGLSAQGFSRAFAKVFGTTVHQYVLQRRLERAKHLLAASDAAVVDIAVLTGFSSQSHLATAFRRLTGVTPGQYRGSGGDA